MTNERAVEILNLDLDILGQYGCETAEAYKMAIKALEAQPCEDCISRQAVIDFIIDNYGVGFNSLTNGIRDYLPSVTPKYTDEEIDKAQAVEQAYVDKMVELAVEETKRQKGKWILNDYQGVQAVGYLRYHCSECGREICSKYHGKISLLKEYPYCHCGAEMEGEEDV